MKSEERKRWIEWVTKDVDKGARNAHRFSRLPKARVPTAVENENGRLSGDLVELLGAQRWEYKKAWDAAKTPIRCRWVDIGGGKKEEELPRLIALELREASCSLGHDTA